MVVQPHERYDTSKPSLQCFIALNLNVAIIKDIVAVSLLAISIHELLVLLLGDFALTKLLVESLLLGQFIPLVVNLSLLSAFLVGIPALGDLGGSAFFLTPDLLSRALLCLDLLRVFPSSSKLRGEALLASLLPYLVLEFDGMNIDLRTGWFEVELAVRVLELRHLW